MRRRIGVAIVAALTSVLSIGSVPASAVSADRDTRLQHLAFSATGASLRGLQVQYVDVALRLTDPDGVPRERGTVDEQRLECPCVLVVNENVGEPRSRPFRAVSLRLASGSETDGVWVGRFAVGAADAGFWRVAQLHAGDLSQDLPSTLVATPSPWRQVTLNVRGSDWPYIWLGTRVRLRPGTDIVRGGAYLVRSRTPLRGVRLEIHEECIRTIPRSFTAVRTDRQGRYAFSFAATEGFGAGVCAALVAYPTTDNGTSLVAVSNIRSLPRIG